MCAILDADVRDAVFGKKPTSAGGIFFKWINSGRGCLVVSKRLWNELKHKPPETFKMWEQQLILAGKKKKKKDLSLRKLSREDEEASEEFIAELESANVCRSNDVHILALAKVSGSRLLFSNDKALWDDFRDRNILQPKGKIYSKCMNKQTCEKLLAQRDLCDRVRELPQISGVDLS